MSPSPQAPTHFILVGNAPGFPHLHQLGKAMGHGKFVLVENAEALRELLPGVEVPLVILDSIHCGGDFSGLAGLTREHPAVPMVVMADGFETTQSLAALSAGALDVVSLSELTAERLERLSRQGLRFQSQHLELSSLKEALRHSPDGKEPSEARRRARIQLESSLEARERDYQALYEKYHDLYENAVEGIFRFSSDGRVLDANPAFFSLLGLGGTGLSQGTLALSSFWADPEMIPQFFSRLKSEGRVKDFEVAFHTRGGDLLYVLMSARAVHGSGGQFLRVEGSVIDITERKEVESRLLYDATHDPLTALPNRAALIEALRHALEEKPPSFTLALLDIDAFRMIIDSLGHRRADRLLIELGRRLASALQGGETAYRPGGDEFVLLLGSVEMEGVRGRLLAIQQQLSRPLQIGDRSLLPTMTVGLAPSRVGVTAEDLLREAGSAMERARRRGRGAVEVFQYGRHGLGGDRLALEEEIRLGLMRGEFEVVYQPIIRLAGGHIKGYEGLVRWAHPQQGTLSPSSFITAAEDSGLIHSLGDFVLDTILMQHRKWIDKGHDQLMASVNFSVRQLMDPGLPQRVEAALKRSGVPAQNVRAEITESIELDGSDQVAQVVNQLTELGLGLAMDDFGTGFSSLMNLKKYKFSALKIDKAFVSGLPGSREDQSVVHAILNLAQGLDLEVVAEGVERAEQAVFLNASKCALAQGYYHSRPVAASVFGDLLSAR